MKKVYKLFVFAAFCMISIHASAQKAQVKSTLIPGVFTPEDEVILEVDVAGTTLSGKEIYIWAFVDGVGDSKVNTAFNNSPEEAKFTLVSPDKWRYTFTGTSFFNKASSELVNKPFGFLVKTKDGTIQSEDYRPAKFSPVLFVPSLFRNFPIRLSQYDAVSIFLDQQYGTTPETQRFTPTTINLKLFDDTNTQVDIDKTGLPVVKQADGSYGYTFIPNILFTVPDGKKLSKVSFTFSGTTLDGNGAAIPYTSESGDVIFLDLK